MSSGGAAILSRMIHQPPRRRISIVGVLIALTLSVCVIALAFRHDLRSRYWAYRVMHSASLAERAGYLNQLMAAGDYSQWGLRTLAEDSSAENRQFAAIALQTIHAPWARGLLYVLLKDSEPAVSEVAILGLALQHDEAALRELARMYRQDATEEALAARTACAGLQRFGDARAVATLAALAEVPATPNARAALVDALGDIGGASAVAPLIVLLDDHRPSNAPKFEAEMAMRVLGDVPAGQAAPLLARNALGGARDGTSQPVSEGSANSASATPPRTIAERAAEALGLITGRRPPFLSSMSETDRRLAQKEWESWGP